MVGKKHNVILLDWPYWDNSIVSVPDELVRSKKFLLRGVKDTYKVGAVRLLGHDFYYAVKDDPERYHEEIWWRMGMAILRGKQARA